MTREIVRVWIGTVLAFVSATPSAAQSYYCSRPSEPYIRSGYSADYNQMQRTQREVEQYVDDMNDYLECVANEHADAASEVDDVVDQWDSAVRRFNNQ